MYFSQRSYIITIQDNNLVTKQMQPYFCRFKKNMFRVVKKKIHPVKKKDN